MPGSRAAIRLWIGIAGTIALLSAETAPAQSLPPVWQSWLASLQSQGYTVLQGSALEFNDVYCQQTLYPFFHSCFSNDPNDPYIVPLPPVGDGYVDPYFGPSAGMPDAAGVPVAQIYHLALNEAVVSIVTLPPTAAYFSYQSYLFTRPARVYRHAQQLSPDPARALIFGTFNNSINNVDIARQSGLEFGTGIVAFITTPNKSLAASLSSSFASVGGRRRFLFTEAMGTNLNPGLGQNNDDFTSVIRYSDPQDPVAGNLWRSDAAANVQVFRIIQPREQGAVTYPQTPLLPKSFNTDESDQSASLSELSQILRNWLAAEENDSTVSVHASDSSEKVAANGVVISGEVGPYCIKHGTDCGADSQDTDAYKTADIGTLPAGRMFMVDGVNHAVTDDATFFSVSVSDPNTATGVAAVSQTSGRAAGFKAGPLTGSAADVLHSLGLYQQASSSLRSDLGQLYVAIFTRPCPNAAVYCLQPYTTNLDPAVLPYADSVVMTERAYLLPGFVNGADPDYLLNPDVIY